MGNRYLKISTLGSQEPRQANGQPPASGLTRLQVRHEGVFQVETFHRMLTLERRRAERSRKPFVLMLIDAQAVIEPGNGATFIERFTSAVCDAARETDIVGWYKESAILAVIFTEVSLDGKHPITEVLESKVGKVLKDRLGSKLVSVLAVTTHLFPESWDKDSPDRVADIKLYPDLSRRVSKKRLPTIVKRGIDVVGGGLLLIVLSPLFAAIALAIKLASKGPVIFEQERMGQFGKSFKCLKFRTMYTNNDPKIHREYVQSFIAGKMENGPKNEAEPVVYKLTNDPRVTPIGRLLRKTSLDEFPQLWNVLRGEMSLVGPRPPVRYEFEVYDVWHRRRVLEVKPGITGLWQVSGRSRTCFDDMVRLDLRYSQSWSLWLDVKILLATPLAIVEGDGAH
jgi:lipopolysaccharide/colanic/teichoic acid biosynthesis glycosyltransferase